MTKFIEYSLISKVEVQMNKYIDKLLKFGKNRDYEIFSVNYKPEQDNETKDNEALKKSVNEENKALSNNSENDKKDNITVCPKCNGEFVKEEIKNNLNVCLGCGHHFVISAERRVKYLVDQGSFRLLKCKVAFFRRILDL